MKRFSCRGTIVDMSREKIIDRKKLVGILNRLRNEGKKTVFTNGCFDIIHVGHIRYLEQANKLGDTLVIGLNSDRSVSAIKSGRPFTPEDQRAEVLSSLSMVDYVTLFDEDTPYELIKALRPDILVKGADWKTDEIVGNDIVKDVRTIPLVQGISTTGIIRKIQESVR